MYSKCEVYRQKELSVFKLCCLIKQVRDIMKWGRCFIIFKLFFNKNIFKLLIQYTLYV